MEQSERNFDMLFRDAVKLPQKYVNRLLELEKELEDGNEATYLKTRFT